MGSPAGEQGSSSVLEGVLAGRGCLLTWGFGARCPSHLPHEARLHGGHSQLAAIPTPNSCSFPELSRLRGRKEEGEAMPPPRQGRDSEAGSRGRELCLCGRDRESIAHPFLVSRSRAPGFVWRVEVRPWESHAGSSDPLFQEPQLWTGTLQLADASRHFSPSRHSAPHGTSPHPGAAPLYFQPTLAWAVPAGQKRLAFRALPGGLPSLPPSLPGASRSRSNRETLPRTPLPTGAPPLGMDMCPRRPAEATLEAI